MALKREGPFEIEEVMGPVTYRLKLPQEWKVHNVFHATLLKPYVETETYGENYTRPPSDLLEEQEVYEVETIVKHRRRGKGYQYFIKWKGYPIEEATWEPETNISKDGDMLTRYKLRQTLKRYNVQNNNQEGKVVALPPIITKDRNQSSSTPYPFF